MSFEQHAYSVPHTLTGKELDLRITATTVEAFFQNRRVASHARSHRRGAFTTVAAHMPEAHRAIAEWTPERLTAWAAKTGPATAELIEKILASKPHPQQGYRACLGILRLGKSQGEARLEAACQRALALGAHSYRSVAAILKHHLEGQPLSAAADAPVIEHGNIRGSDHGTPPPAATAMPAAAMTSAGTTLAATIAPVTSRRLRHADEPHPGQAQDPATVGHAGRARRPAAHTRHRQPHFEERLGLLIDREETMRADRRLRTRLTQAKLRVKASIEDIDYRAKRGLSKAAMLDLAQGRWIEERHNLLITGPTGVGKTYLACALGNQACRHGKRAQYQRLPRLLHELDIGKGDGRYQSLLAGLQRIDLLILDDWGLAPLTDSGRRDLLEILDDRYNTRSTLITSQLPIDAWHAYLGDPTLADAILDRVIHNAHKLELRGDSLRKTKGGLTSTTSPEAQ